ncbi:MAG: DUF1501 domain-containing protein [Verrucomicrobiota bacterium]
MEETPSPYPLTRREFLHRSAGGLGLLAFSGFVPAFITQAAAARVPQPDKDRTILVLIQLAGGNDGLNTVIPVYNDQYYKLRPRLAIKRQDAIQLDSKHYLNPNMGAVAELWKEGKLSIVNNVGYPNPNRSHFRSTEIWETAVDSDRSTHTGWIGRYLDSECEGKPRATDPQVVHVGDELPQSVLSTKPHNIFGLPNRGRVHKQYGQDLLQDVLASEMGEGNAGYLQNTLMDAMVTEQRVADILAKYKPMAEYGGTNLGRSLQRVAALIASGMETRVYFVKQTGYDTHSGQNYRHGLLLKELSDAMGAFQADMEKHRLQDQVLTMTFSEFGRRPNENNSSGTDHGTAAPLFVMGTGVKDSIVGQPPNLNVEHNQDLSFSTDFRQVYATVIQNWFQADTGAVIDKPMRPLGFV